MSNVEKSSQIEPRSRVLTASNLLSISRIFILLPIIYCLNRGTSEPKYNLIALAIMFVGALTDTFDGWLARKLNQVTELGKIVDPVADKIGIAVILGFLAFKRPDFPLWFLIIALSRDVIIFVLGLYVKRKYNYLFVSNMLGKSTVTAIALMVFVFVIKDNYNLDWVFISLMWLCLLLLFASSFSYAVRFFGYFRTSNRS